MAQVNLALIGTGQFSFTWVLPALEELRKKEVDVINLVAVSDVNLERAKAFAKRASISLGKTPAVYSDYREMLKKEKDVEAVYIVVDHASHHRIAVDCLNDGKHVLVEKPLGVTMRAAKLIIEAAKSNNRILAVAENYRRRPLDRAIKWSVERGMIGSPRFFTWISSATSRGFNSGFLRLEIRQVLCRGRFYLGCRGALRRLMAVYPGGGGGSLSSLENLRALRYEDWPKRSKPVPVTVEDTTVSILKLKGDMVGVFLWTTVAPGETYEQWVIYGDKGSLSWQKGFMSPGEGGVGTFSLSPRELVSTMMSSLPQEVKEKWFPKGVGVEMGSFGVSVELLDFADSIINHRKPEVDGEEGAKDEAVILAMYESSFKGGKPVAVKEVEELEVEDYQREINERLGLK
jgi:Predicted dehydrogenases and related proteins